MPLPTEIITAGGPSTSSMGDSMIADLESLVDLDEQSLADEAPPTTSTGRRPFRILCTLALAGMAVHYTAYKIPQQFLLRGPLSFLEPPRRVRRLVDTTTQFCSCPCQLAGTEEQEEGWLMNLLDQEMVTVLGGDPSVCISKSQSPQLQVAGRGTCDETCHKGDDDAPEDKDDDEAPQA